MKTTATVLREMGTPGPFAETEPLVEQIELDLEAPGQNELLIRYSGLPDSATRTCRSSPVSGPGSCRWRL